MNKNAVIFPYNRESACLVKHKDLLKEYKIVALVSPVGFGMSGKDASWIYNGEKVGISVYTSFEDIQVKFDTVIISDIDFEVDFKKTIYPEILKAINNKKNIICLHKLEDEMYKEIKKLCILNNVHFKYPFTIFDKKSNYTKICELKDEHLFNINIPIILVAGFMEKTNKFDIQLSLRKYFVDKGYKVSQIGTRNYCELFGFHSFPDFMFDNIPEWEKVLYFNRLCKEIEMTEESDLIILGIPGAIMPYNNIFTNKFGILAFEIANAISPDAVIISTLYSNFTTDYFDNICQYVKYKFGFNIDCINLSNNKFESNNSKHSGVIDLITVGTQMVDKQKNKFKEYDIPVFNSLNAQDSINIGKYIEDKLNSYTNSQTL